MHRCTAGVGEKPTLWEILMLGFFPQGRIFFHMPTLAVSHIPLSVQYWVEDLQRVWNNLNIVILVSLQEMNSNNVSKHNDGNY